MKITLLGDSIRQIGYGTVVPDILGDKYEVYQPEENCRFAKYTLRGLWDWETAMEGSRIVHWNNGLWDTGNVLGDGQLLTSKEEYLETMLRIARILTKKYEKVIFATTTPVAETHPYNQNSDIIEYNHLIVPELEKMGIIINDLFGFVYPKTEAYIRKDDLIHLTDEGIWACGNEVARKISEVAKTLK